MKKWLSTVAFATLAHLAMTGCDNGNGGGSTSNGGGSGGNGGNGGDTTTSSGGSGGSSSSSSGGGALDTGECRTSADCTDPGGALCRSPDAPPLCGICYEPPTPCTTDAECAAQTPGTICEQPGCSCGASECLPGCTSDSECGDWQYCSPQNRCLPDPCTVDADCPTNFACTSMACGRKACTSDADCNGYCVNAQCYDVAGTCMLPPP